MTADIVQANYDNLDSVAARFGQQAELAADLQGRVRHSFEALEHGGWMGRGSTAFIAEMYGELFPATQRLQHVLNEARAVTLQIKEILQRAEQEAAALFGGGTSGTTQPVLAPGGKKPILIVVNGVTNETGAKANYTKDSWQAFLKGKGLTDKDVIFAPAIYNNEKTPRFMDFGKFFGGKDHSDLAAIKDEMNRHGDFKDSYTKRLEDALGKKLAGEDRPVIIVAHSGGGGVAPELASRLMKSGVKVEGVATLGSPFVDWKSAPPGIKKVAIRDTHDWIGNPDKTIDFGYGGQWKGKPDKSYTIDGGYSWKQVPDAHGSYFKSETAWKLLVQEFPDLAPAK